MIVRGYSDLSLTDIRIANERIMQLQAFLNRIAPEYGLTPGPTDGRFTGATEVLLMLILRAEGQPSTIAPGVGLAIHNATGIGLATAEGWEWAILIAMERAGRGVLPSGSPARMTIREAFPGEEPAMEKQGWVAPVIAGSAFVLALVGVALVATRRK